MPFRRRTTTYKRRRVVRRTRRPRGSYSLMRSPRKSLSSMNKVYFFKQTVANSPIVQTNSFVAYPLSIYLGLLDQAATFTSLYSEYKIVKVVLMMIPQVLQTQAAYTVPISGAAPIGGIIGTALYRNPQAVPANLTAFQVSNTYRWQSTFSRKKHIRSIRPVVENVIFQSNTPTTSYSIGKPSWIPTTAPTVPHFGIAVGVSPYATIDSAQSWFTYVTYYVAFRNVI